MTKSTIDPVISTDPERTAELAQMIADWRTALKAHQKALKDLGTQSGKKAERKATKDAITTCETTIEGLAKQLPPTYTDPELAVARIREMVQALDRLDEAKAEFIESFNANPHSAIEWRAAGVIKAQTVNRYVYDWTAHLDRQGGDLSPALMPTLIQEWTDQVTRDLISGTRDSHSTSPFDNVCEKMVQAARADLISDFSGVSRIKWEAEALAKAVQASAAVREM